jgi:hypothetical protein
VVPAVAGLKRQGASRGAVISFMVSTPETGVDSIPVTYALMDPLMAIIRPIAAFITAMTAGLLENHLNRTEEPQPFAMAGSNPMPLTATPPLSHRLKSGLHFAFVTLLGDIGPYFLVGVMIAGLISAMVPTAMVEDYLGNPLLAMPVMLLVSLPMYVCATASTPIAAALVLKGLSPGAALVFLLAGPATNAASLSMVTAMMGRRSTTLYVAAIVVCSLILGAGTDMIYRAWALSPVAMAGQAAELIPESVKLIAAVVLLAMITPSLGRLLMGKLTPKTT